MNRDTGLTVEQAKMLADELVMLVEALERDLSELIKQESETLADNLFPPNCDS